MTLKAIETVYNGYRFRSRLEARWAVFFDALAIDYQYEPEGFDLGEAGAYLPDFVLPEFQVYCEIKPKSALECRHCESQCRDSYAWEAGPCVTAYPAGGPPSDVLAFHLAEALTLSKADDHSVLLCYGDPGDYATHVYTYAPVGVLRGIEIGGIACYHNEYRFCTCARCDMVYLWGYVFLYGLGFGCESCCITAETEDIQRAIRAARSARFEHGESGGRDGTPRP
jgi:hypothetical protein